MPLHAVMCLCSFCPPYSSRSRSASCCIKVSNSPSCWLLQRQATSDTQWFRHLQHEIAILSKVSHNRNIVQVSRWACCVPLQCNAMHPV